MLNILRLGSGRKMIDPSIDREFYGASYVTIIFVYICFVILIFHEIFNVEYLKIGECYKVEWPLDRSGFLWSMFIWLFFMVFWFYQSQRKREYQLVSLLKTVFCKCVHVVFVIFEKSFLSMRYELFLSLSIFSRYLRVVAQTIFREIW